MNVFACNPAGEALVRQSGDADNTARCVRVGCPIWGALLTLLLAFAAIALSTATATAQNFQSSTAALLESSCFHCHDESTDTDLNFESLGHDLSDPATFRMWEKVFDRSKSGEMPPPSEDRPDPDQLNAALDSLNKDLYAASAARQKKVGRVPARRLTKTEFGYTIQDLLLIEHDVTRGVPDEVDAGTFDTVGSNQRISAVHLESYLEAVDQALGHAIKFGTDPYHDYGDFADTNFAHLNVWHEKPIRLGGSVTRKLKFGKGVALFRDVDYITQFTYAVRTAGVHRLTAKVAAFQSRKPITAKFIVKSQSGSARLAKAIDLLPGEPQTVVVETFLEPGDAPYLTYDSGGPLGEGAIFTVGAKNFRGPGLAILGQRLEGPIHRSWPPPGMKQLFASMMPTDQQPGENGKLLKYSKPPADHLRELVAERAPRVFRRDVSAEEIARFVELGRPALADQKRYLPDAFKLSLRSMMTSPQFLMFGGEPGKLDDFALANRLSYFLWKSMPDDELFEIARSGKLTNSAVLKNQVQRMLDDDKSHRFIGDFLGQWLWLHKVHATSPDDGLYPEWDELLSDAVATETELFFAELLRENLSLTHLVDSDFTFLNRRLAQHYNVKGVKGQGFRKVSLPSDSIRGGILTQAAILKTTANGTTTSPVMRGNFVLTNFLGTPPSPPPPDIGSIEPDTRGKTTIREILAAHREMESCNQCHREIDPPGFALESFDPIGGFRQRYRADGGSFEFGGFVQKNPPRQGPPVDASGVTADGKKFDGIDQFKLHLLANHKKQIARNFISKLVVYATGAEIQFADREKVEAILERTAKDDFPIRNIVHEVIQSELFRNK